jgi:hypothetical protein
VLDVKLVDERVEEVPVLVSKEVDVALEVVAVPEVVVKLLVVIVVVVALLVTEDLVREVPVRDPVKVRVVLVVCVMDVNDE